MKMKDVLKGMSTPKLIATLFENLRDRNVAESREFIKEATLELSNRPPIQGPKGDKGDPGVGAPLINNLSEGGTEAALTAEMGKMLLEKMDNDKTSISDTMFNTLQEAINYAIDNNKKLVLNREEYTISTKILIPGDISIDFNNKKITPTVDMTFHITGKNVNIENAVVDFGLTSGPSKIFYIGNESNTSIKNIVFSNLVDTVNVRSFYGIVGEKGINLKINNISAKNIKLKGDVGVNNGNAVRIVWTSSSSSTKPTKIMITGIDIDECYNITSTGELLIDDCDIIGVQHSPDERDMISISGGKFLNCSKRLIKSQCSNLNISDIQAYNDNIEVFNPIELVYPDRLKNININNIMLTGMNKLMSLHNVSDANISNIICKGVLNSNQNFAFNTSNSDGLNIFNMNIADINNGIAIMGGNISNIKMSNINLSVFSRAFSIANQSTDDATTISDISIDNLYLKTLQDYTTTSLFICQATKTTVTKNINLSRIKMDLNNATYQYGAIKFYNVENLSVDDLSININNRSGQEVLFLENVTGSISKLKINCVNKDLSSNLVIRGNTEITLDNCNIDSNISINGTTAKIVIDSCKYKSITYNNGATASQVTIK